jgi:hypothetical protein
MQPKPTTAQPQSPHIFKCFIHQPDSINNLYIFQNSLHLDSRSSLLLVVAAGIGVVAAGIGVIGLSIWAKMASLIACDDVF